MRALTIPRTVAGAEYAAMRFPLTLVQKAVLTRLDEQSSLRLGAEKAIGTLDATVGRVLADPALTRRGATLSRRADILTKAVQLEEKAKARTQQANAELAARKAEAERQREAAVTQAQAQAKALHDQQQADKRAAEATAQASARAKVAAAEREAAAKLDAEESKLESRLDSIESRTQARTAAPKAQLQDAAKAAAQAARERKDADRLASLAATEKASRKR